MHLGTDPHPDAFFGQNLIPRNLSSTDSLSIRCETPDEQSMTAINLGTATFTLAKAKLQLDVAACASLNGPDLLPKDNADLLTTDIWMDKGHSFHFSFNVSFNELLPDPGAANEDSIAAFIALILTQAPVCHVRSCCGFCY